MSDSIQQRDYYRIFTGTNQEDGYEKIHLGYEASTTEIILNKDTETHFHIPFFAGVVPIQQSSLITDGALPGPIPALADRVFKKLGNYGNTTPWGTPTERHDGTWLCSWLYAVSSEPPIWLDRFYNPGRLAYKEALEGTANFTDYIKQDPIYYDVPSSLTFEPGVLYKYFHQGETSAAENVKTFAGADKSKLRLHVEDWSCLCSTNTNPIDQSIYNNTVIINDFKDDWIVSLPDPGYQDRNSLSFNNSDFIQCRATYDTSYNLEDEFTVSFWLNNNNWSTATSTQLIGNLSRGGYGVFYNNLYYNPIYVIPENTYGHLFYINQEGTVYTEKNIQTTLGIPTDPEFVAINLNAQVIILNTTNRQLIKYNHLGDVLTTCKDLSGNLLTIEGDPKLFALSGDNLSLVVTTSGTYIYDQDLLLLQSYNQPYGYKEQITFDYNGNLIRELSCLDVKIDTYNQKWTIKEDKQLYCDGALLSSIEHSCTNLAIDPENNLWVLAGSNTVYKINTKNKTILNTFEVGAQTSISSSKNIGFIKSYNRNSNSMNWLAIIYHNFEKTFYETTLDGNILKAVFLPPKLNILDPATALQDKNLLTFNSKGDFTGYEHKRIFNKVLYNNSHQIQFKVAVKHPNRSLPTSIITLSIPVQYFTDQTWHLTTITLKNNIISIYIDNYLRDFKKIPGNIDINYDFKSDLFIGTPVGKGLNYNLEIGTNSIIWNGYIDSIRIYDYAIESKFIQCFVREKIISSDIEWNIPTAALQYVDVIERFFKHRLPGAKSMFFNLRVTGTGITDTTIRQRIEEDLKLAIEDLKPGYAELLRVEWIN